MERARLWTRLGNLFGGRDRSAGSEGDHPAGGVLQARSAKDIGVSGGAEAAAGRSGPAPKAVLPRRESALDRLEENYAVVTQLMESIRKHFELQEERVERMAHALDQVGAALAHMPEASRTQSEVLSAIKTLVESTATSATRAEESLSQIPRVADAQRETMVSIGRQLDLLRGSGDRGMEALSRFHEEISRLSDATGASMAALKDMHTDSVAREKSLQDAVEMQTKRLTLFSALTVSIAAIAIVLGLIALFA